MSPNRPNLPIGNCCLGQLDNPGPCTCAALVMDSHKIFRRKQEVGRLVVTYACVPARTWSSSQSNPTNRPPRNQQDYPVQHILPMDLHPLRGCTPQISVKRHDKAYHLVEHIVQSP